MPGPYVPPPQVTLLRQTPQLLASMTIIRDQTTGRDQFKKQLTRIGRLVVEEALNHLPIREKQIMTPTGEKYDGVEWVGGIVGAVVLRAALALQGSLEEVCPDIRMCHLLIQRDEKTSEPLHSYTKAPADIANRNVLLLDPMLATGGSICAAIGELKKLRVPENQIIFLNIISAPEGITRVTTEYPGVRIVTAAIDRGLNEKNYIVPGLGDAGDRFFGTN